MIPTMDLCVKHRKDIYLWEKQAWWAVIPASKMYRSIFHKKYSRNIMARTEESNSRCPEINLMAMVGLYKCSLIKGWGVNIIPDQWRVYSPWILEYDFADPSAILRQLVAYASAGATDFRLQYDLGLKRKSGGWEFSSSIGSLVLDTFIHMLGKGILVSPSPQEIEGISPLIISFHEPHRGVLWTAKGNVENFDIDEEAQDGLFSGYTWWGLRPTHPYYLPSYILKTRRYGHNFIPETPYGLPVIVPYWTPPEKLDWVKGTIETDGVYVLKKSQKLEASQSKEKILSKFCQYAEELIFRAEGIWCMGRKIRKNSYRIVLVDPGIFSPSPLDRKVKLRINKEYTLESAYDVIEERNLTFRRNFVEVKIPAGTFKILDIVVKKVGRKE